MAKAGKQKQAKPDESAELAQALMRCAGTGIYIVRDGKFRYVNALFQELTGYSEPELLDKYSLDLVHPEDKETVRKKATESLKVGSSLPYEYRFVKKNGEIIWVLEKVTSTEYKGKRATVGSFLDITERKLAEEKLLDSQARYRSIVETGGAGVLVGDLDGNITFVNSSFCKILGYSSEELVGKPFADFLHPDDKAMVLEKFAEGLANPEAGYQLEFRATHRDGHTVWIHPSVAPVFHKNVLSTGTALVFDITERKRLEETIKKSEERYRTILEEIQDSYFETDLDGNLTFVNDAMCRTMGYSKEELVGMNYRVFATKDDVEVVYRDFNRVYHTGEAIKGLSYKFVQKNGTVGFGELSISAIKNEEGEVIAFRGIARDVTERSEEHTSELQSHLNLVCRLLLEKKQIIPFTDYVNLKLSLSSMGVRVSMCY